MSQFRHLRIAHDYDRSPQQIRHDIVNLKRDILLEEKFAKLRTAVVPRSLACNAATLERLKTLMTQFASKPGCLDILGMEVVVDGTLQDGFVEGRARNGSVVCRFQLNKQGAYRWSHLRKISG